MPFNGFVPAPPTEQHGCARYATVRLHIGFAKGWTYVIGPDQDLDIEMTTSQPVEPLVIGEGVRVTWQVPMFKSAVIPKMIDVAVQIIAVIPAGVAANIITGWIISRFKGKAKKSSSSARRSSSTMAS